jgi:hypothetical protein
MPDRADQAKAFLEQLLAASPSIVFRSLLQIADERLVPGRVHK